MLGSSTKEVYRCTLMGSQHDTGCNLPDGNSQGTVLSEKVNVKFCQGDLGMLNLLTFKSLKEVTPCSCLASVQTTLYEDIIDGGTIGI